MTITAAGNTTTYYGGNGSNANVTNAQVASHVEVPTSGSEAGSLSFATRSSGGGISRKMQILANGNVGVGTTAPVGILDVTGVTASIFTRSLSGSSGLQSATQWGLKGNSASAGTGPTMLFFADNSAASKSFLGRVGAVWENPNSGSEAVKTNETTGMKAVEYGNLVSPLLEAFKESHTNHESRIKVVEAENKKLKNENDELKKRLDRLEQMVMRNIASEKKK